MRTEKFGGSCATPSCPCQPTGCRRRGYRSSTAAARARTHGTRTHEHGHGVEGRPWGAHTSVTVTLGAALAGGSVGSALTQRAASASTTDLARHMPCRSVCAVALSCSASAEIFFLKRQVLSELAGTSRLSSCVPCGLRWRAGPVRGCRYSPCVGHPERIGLDQFPRRGLEFRGITWDCRGVPACGMRSHVLHLPMMGAYFNDVRAGFSYFNDGRIFQCRARMPGAYSNDGRAGFAFFNELHGLCTPGSRITIRSLRALTRMGCEVSAVLW